MNKSHTQNLPSLPQNDNEKQQKDRAFQISIAKTNYNYMFSYMEPIPISAGLPKGEGLTLDYDAKLLKVFLPLLENFKDVVVSLIEKEITADLPTEAIESIVAVEEAFEKLKKDMDSHNPFKVIKEFEDVKDIIEALVKVPKEIERAIHGIGRLPKDLYKIVTGLVEVFKEFEKEGFTAFLKNTIYDTLDTERGRDYLLAETIEDYDKLYPGFTLPMSMEIEQKPWMIMKPGQMICHQDWYFGYMQIAGFNTTNLKAVLINNEQSPAALLLSDLLAKMPVNDDIFQNVIDNKSLSLQQAAEKGLLYACDYSQFVGLKGSELHEQQRYPNAPIALFYWNSEPPAGYPPTGALQAVAIQLGQEHDAEAFPIFTPNDCTDNQDSNGVKWHLAKFIVQNACAIQHETVAHLGACHLVIEPMVLAAHRQLAEDHPLMVLLKPHFRFTIEINDAAIHSLIVPGGVVASVLSTSLESSAELIVRANAEWKFDDQYPDVLFERRGISEDNLSEFPFRQDTLDIWSAISDYVTEYLSIYYGDTQEERNANIKNDYELQNWVNEMVNPKYASVKGMDGLTKTGDDKKPYQIDDFDYFARVVSLIIYTASAQHAGVNYAQYPLMSYLPSVSGSLYNTPPSRSDTLDEKSILKWLPPLDVSLYQLSFGYLLSSIQYDTLGYYTDNPRLPYFQDKRVHRVLVDFQMQLKQAEIKIHDRNNTRPMPYELQLPSIIPNSISI